MDFEIVAPRNDRGRFNDAVLAAAKAKPERLRPNWGSKKRERRARAIKRGDIDPLNPPASYREYLLSEAWRTKRARAFRFHGRVCNRCGARNCALEVHHKKYDRLGREPLRDLEILCSVCHGQEHSGLAERWNNPPVLDGGA